MAVIVCGDWLLSEILPFLFEKVSFGLRNASFAFAKRKKESIQEFSDPKRCEEQ
jgi:hypothetical protein